jgi:hypothetical protein
MGVFRGASRHNSRGASGGVFRAKDAWVYSIKNPIRVFENFNS